jgi:hypothetical protein
MTPTEGWRRALEESIAQLVSSKGEEPHAARVVGAIAVAQPTRADAANRIVLGAILGLALAASLAVSPHGLASLADMIGPVQRAQLAGPDYFLGPDFG